MTINTGMNEYMLEQCLGHTGTISNTQIGIVPLHNAIQCLS